MSVHTLPQPSFYSKLIYSSVSIHLLFLLLNLNIFPKQKQVTFLLVFLMAVQLPPCIKVRLNIHSSLSLLFICEYLILLETWILKSAAHNYNCLWKVHIHGYPLFLHFELYLVCWSSCSILHVSWPLYHNFYKTSVYSSYNFFSYISEPFNSSSISNITFAHFCKFYQFSFPCI